MFPPRCLGSKTYELIVGPERKLFYTHEAVLSQSPVFEQICDELYEESEELQIELLDDDPTVFGFMLEYMYLGVFHVGETPKRDIEVALLADLYILAEKYQLEGLKKLLMVPLDAIVDDDTDAERIKSFFDAARKIYENTTDLEVVFPKFFRQRVGQLLCCTKLVPYIEADINRCIGDGGRLAQDTFHGYCAFCLESYYEDKTVHDKEKKEAKVARTELEKNLQSTKRKHDALKTHIDVLNTKISAAKATHAAYHGYCGVCERLLS